jgi:hypothetical protein
MLFFFLDSGSPECDLRLFIGILTQIQKITHKKTEINKNKSKNSKISVKKKK